MESFIDSAIPKIQKNKIGSKQNYNIASLKKSVKRKTNPLSPARLAVRKPALAFNNTLTAVIGKSYNPAVKAQKAQAWVPYFAVAVVLALVGGIFSPWKLELNQAGAAGSVTYINGYPTINGNYVDCNGNVDNDSSHHTTDPNDTDPAHHIGQNCPVGSVIAQMSQSSGIQSATVTSSSSNIISGGSATIQQAAMTTTSKVNVWWPVDGATLLGTQPFKAALDNTPLGNYQMFWQVDSGNLNLMDDNQQDSPHKQAMVDLSSWTWRGSGPYRVTFVAKSLTGQVLASKDVNIYIPASISPTASTVAPATYVTQQTVTQPTSQTQTAAISSGNPFAGQNFYRDPNNNAQQWINQNGSSQPGNASLMQKIASQPNAVWLGGWNSNVQSDVQNVISKAKSQGQMPILVVYNIPNRDCGGYSAGGTQTAADYENWIRQIAAGIGSNKVAVVLEPDGTALTSCLSSTELQTRYQLLSDAVSKLKASGSAAVYIDAGHSNWIEAGDMANRLKQSGIATADGFAVNVSNFNTTNDSIIYGQAISSQVGGKHFIIDTSRNGLGPSPDNAWCNPSGRGLGSKPTWQTGNNLVDAFIWAKDPGGSDGNCNGGPNAGVFWPDYALGLAQRSIW